MLDEFAGGVDGTISRLDYLADLGVNCLEIMPVSNGVHDGGLGLPAHRLFRRR
jgi:1,4-alpha-glucan branching enzyme